MQNVQNAAEIQQRVINLVELYRTKVGKESQIAKDAKKEHDFWEQESIDMAIDSGDSFIGSVRGEGPHTEIWIKHLMVNEQLLGYFYSVVAGEKAEKEILGQLLPDVYDKTVFTAEEETFLADHFKEMVNYIILTPCDDSLKLMDRYDSKDIDLIPKEVLNLIARRISIPDGATIYNPFTGFAQITNLYLGCKFYCEESYEVFNRRWNAFCDAEKMFEKVDNIGLLQAWMKVALYANRINAEVIENGEIPYAFDAMLSFLPEVPNIEENEAFAKASQIEGLTVASKIASAYRNLKDGGVMGLLVPCDQLFENEKRSSQFKAFLECLIKEGDLTEIIQLPKVMSNNANFDTYCLIIAKKKRKEKEITIIDAQWCFQMIENSKHYLCTFDIAQFNAILENDGKDPNTGLRKVVKVSSDNLVQDILVPQVYTVDRPSNTENPIPLSNLCVLESNQIRDVQFDLPEDTPWVTQNDFTPLYTGDLDVSNVRKADCPNNPTYVEGSEDYAFDKEGKFVDSIWSQMYTKKGHRVLDYRLCTYLNGNCDAVLYNRSAEYGIQVAVVRATGKPYAVSSGILVLCPNDDFDANSLAALLRLPIVYRQLIAYQEYGLSNHLGEILVPTDKRIIGDELYRMKREESVSNELGDKVQTMKTEYINEVRMRKHDMRPHLRQLASSQRLMLHYIDCASDIEELKRNLRNQLEHIHVALTSLSSIVDHLSDEEKFGTPELLNIDSLLADIEVNHDESEGFAIEYDCDIESFRKHGFVIPDLSEQWQFAKEHGLDMAKFIQAKSKENIPLFVSIAPLDFQRMVENIIENARKHGFTDHTRTDYYIGIDLSMNSERNMYQIDFFNNGTPLPDGMTKVRYGLKGEKAGQTGGTGSGGYIVKSIVSHYGGDYDVICEDGITTIRIYLPIERYENKV